MNRYLRSGLLAVLTAAGLGLLALAFLVADSDSEQELPAEIERLVPEVDAIIRPQSTVGADLVAGFDGTLFVDGQEVPLDQQTRVDALGQIYFRPGEGKDVLRFEPGEHTVTVLYWPAGKTRADGRSFGWSFRVG